MLKHDPKPIESIRGLTAVLFTKRVSLMLVGTLPFVVGGLMDALHLTASQAGLVTTVELGFAVITGLISTVYLPRLPRYRITVVAVVVVAIAHLMAASGKYFVLFIASRVIAGCAEGIIASTTTSAIATAKNPDRLTAMLLSFGGISGLIFSALISWANVRWGITGVYIVLSLYCWSMLLVIRWLPTTRTATRKGTEPSLKLKGAALALPVLAGYFFWLVGESSIWAFVERLGRGIGLDATQIGVVLGIQSIPGLVGSAVAAVLGVRFGRTWPLGLCIALVGVVIAMLSGVKTMTGYASIISIWTFLLSFSVPYIFGILASLDDQGRWLAFEAVALPLGTAVGPYLGGLAIETFGYDSLGKWVALSYAVIFMLMVPVSMRVSTSPPTPRKSETPDRDPAVVKT